MLFIYYRKEDGIKVALKYIVIFLVSFTLYEVISNLILSIMNLEAADYLTKNIVWKNGHTFKNIVHLIFTIFKNLMENDDFQNLGLLLCFTELVYIILHKFEKKNWVFYISILVFMISPYLLAILIGNMPPMRARFQIPFVLGFSVYFIYLKHQKDLGKHIYLIIFGIIAFSQLVNCGKIFFTDYQTFKQEKIFATEIENSILERNIDDKKTKIFIGSFSASGGVFFIS